QRMRLRDLGQDGPVQVLEPDAGHHALEAHGMGAAVVEREVVSADQVGSVHGRGSPSGSAGLGWPSRNLDRSKCQAPLVRQRHRSKYWTDPSLRVARALPALPGVLERSNIPVSDRAM